MKHLMTASCAAYLFTAGALLADPITISDAFARANGPNAKAGAAFMVIENTADTADRLIAAATDRARRVELHTHKIDANGVARMREVEGGFLIPANGGHALKRGGDHVMLMGLTQPFVNGETISVTLTFETAGEIVVDMPVRLGR